MSNSIHGPIAAPGIALAGLLSVGLLDAQSPVGSQAEEAAEAEEFEALLGRLTPPLQPGLVRQAVRHPRAADGGAARALVMHLTVHGGAAAVPGLLVLVRHSEAEVRLAALRGIETLGFRSEDVAYGVRAAVDDFEPAVRRAAIAALGKVGDASDVAGLIDMLRFEEQESPTGALRALRSLTGVRIDKDWQSWSYWWSHAEKDLAGRVGAAVGVLTAGGTEVQLADARHLLLGSAWVAPRKLEDAAREWLRSDEPRLRIEAFRLIAGARLADLAGDAAQAFEFEIEPEVEEAGRECLVAMGVLAGHPAAKPPHTPR